MGEGWGGMNLLNKCNFDLEHEMGVKNWKQRVQERKQWKDIIEQAKTHKEL